MFKFFKLLCVEAVAMVTYETLASDSKSVSTANTNILTSNDLVWISLKTHGYLDFFGALHTLKEYKDLKRWKYPIWFLTLSSLNSQISTMEPRFNEVPRDWVHYIEGSLYRKARFTKLRKNNKMFCYIEGWLILAVLLFFVCSFVLFFGVTSRYPAF